VDHEPENSSSEDDERLGNLLDPRQYSERSEGDERCWDISDGTPAEDERRTRDSTGRRGRHTIDEGLDLSVLGGVPEVGCRDDDEEVTGKEDADGAKRLGDAIDLGVFACNPLHNAAIQR
jgi:hypothetical protein